MSESAVEQWIAALDAEFGLELGEVDIHAVLDLARDAAHSVVRPAAPLAAFMAGYAAGKRGAAGTDIAAECEQAAALARGWGGA